MKNKTVKINALRNDNKLRPAPPMKPDLLKMLQGLIDAGLGEKVIRVYPFDASVECNYADTVATLIEGEKVICGADKVLSNGKVQASYRKIDQLQNTEKALFSVTSGNNVVLLAQYASAMLGEEWSHTVKVYDTREQALEASKNDNKHESKVIKNGLGDKMLMMEKGGKYTNTIIRQTTGLGYGQAQTVMYALELATDPAIWSYLLGCSTIHQYKNIKRIRDLAVSNADKLEELVQLFEGEKPVVPKPVTAKKFQEMTTGKHASIAKLGDDFVAGYGDDVSLFIGMLSEMLFEVDKVRAEKARAKTDADNAKADKANA